MAGRHAQPADPNSAPGLSVAMTCVAFCAIALLWLTTWRLLSLPTPDVERPPVAQHLVDPPPIYEPTLHGRANEPPAEPEPMEPPPPPESEPAEPPTTEELLQDLEHGGAERREALRWLVGTMHVDTRIQQALIALLRDADAAVRRDAMRGLLQLGPSGIWAMGQGNQAPTRALLEAARKDRRPVQALIAALSHPEASLRAQVVYLLPDLVARVDDVIPTILRMLATDDIALWHTALGALTALRSVPGDRRDVIEALQTAAWEREPSIRRMAMRALPLIAPEPAQYLPMLEEHLADREVHLRSTAADVLGSLCPRLQEACEALEPALEDPDPRVRELAREWFDHVGDR